MTTLTVSEAPVRQSALIADDDPSMRLVLSASLERLGFEVAAASDGLEALSKALEATFDLVVLDVLMPGADGFEVCTALRQLPRYRLTPILMATGLDDHASIGRAFDAGASDFERKPLNFTLLEHRIRFLMKAADTVRELEGRRVELDFLASHDPLTRLPNRTGLARHLGERIAEDGAQGLGTAVLYLDLDGFKNVNDALGHAFGDRLLRTIVERLRSGLSGHSLLARVGGDEFVLVLDGVDRQEAVEDRARAILDSFEQPFRLDDYEFSIGVSIGICTHPTHGQDADELIRNADLAMYRAKQLGGRRYQVFDERIALQMLERMALLADLRKALANAELALLYQPKVDLGSGRIVGAEALLRWNHPVRGQIPPAVFMPIAEESGLMAEIGHWVVGQALKQAAHWCRPPFNLGHVAVNISGPEMWRSGFAEKVQRAIAEGGVDPASLQLEITETLAMDTANRDDPLQTLVALASGGMTIAIDDFGTGHSSLPHLKLLPVSTLKVDRSFVHRLPSDRNTEGIVRAIIALGNSLSLQLIAEGIETPEQLAWLRDAGCGFGQGYLFSRPVPADAFEALLRTPDPIQTMPASAPSNAGVMSLPG